jgi:hypothetical protein
MNEKKLRQAEKDFFERYPGGFSHPEMIAIRKHHHLDRMVGLAQESFVKRNFRHSDLIVDHMVKIVIRSSLVSRFEKPEFREFASSLLPAERQDLARGLGELLHGNEQTGFEITLALLHTGKLAKWPLMTVCQAYYRPQREVFIKPTTTKGILATFELEDLQYQPAPSWDFYERYRAAINEMKTRVDSSLSPYNIAFTGFLMRSIRGLY